MKKLLVLLLFFSNLYAGDWYRIKGDYSVVEYQQHHRNIADSLFQIAELSLPRIARMCGLPESELEKEKTLIVLTDAPDISNGFAIHNQVVIFATSSAYIPNWTGDQNWYHQVLTHELVHNVTFRKMRRTVNLLGHIAYLSIPRWFLEGTAQYFSEKWNTFRGDYYIKNAVLTGKLNFSSLSNLENGRLLYATAHAFTRFLATEYGDSSLIHLMSYKPDGLYFDFDNAFKAAYGKSAEKIFQKFLRHMILHYGNKYAQYPVFEKFKKLPVFGYNDIQVIPLADQDSLFLVLTQLKSNHLYRSAFIAAKDSTGIEIKENISYNLNTTLFISQDQSKIAYGRYAFSSTDNMTGISYDWFVFDRNNNKTTNIVRNVRARYAAFSPGNDLILAHVNADSSFFVKYIPDQKPENIASTNMPVGYFGESGNGKYLFSAQRNNGHRDLFQLDNKKIKAITDDKTDDRRGLFINDSIIYVNRFVEDNPSLSVINQNSGKFYTALFDQYEYWLQAYDKNSDKLVAARTNEFDKADIVLIDPDSLNVSSKTSTKADIVSRYHNWQIKKPIADVINLPDSSIQVQHNKKVHYPQFNMQHIMSIALPVFDEQNGLGLYGFTTWIEPLQRQAFFASLIGFPQKPVNSFLTLSHMIRLYDLEFNSVYYHGPVFFSFEEGTWIESVRDYAALQIGKRYNPAGNPRWFLYPRIGIGWEQIDVIDKNYKYALLPLNIGANIGYFLPTKTYPLIARREFGFGASIFKIIDKEFDHTVIVSNLKMATNLFIENLAIRNKFSFLRVTGDMPPNHPFGIDRFYNYDLPRDFGFTRTIRGIKEDINGRQLYWNSTELTFLALQSTPFKLIMIPLNNITFNAFFDYAKIQRDPGQVELYGYGIETGFGPVNVRFNTGFSISKNQNSETDQQLYFRISILLPTVF